MERRIVGTEDTTVEVRALLVLFLDSTDVIILDDFDGDHILARRYDIRYVEDAPDEGAIDASQLLTVQIDIGFPVDAVEIQEDPVFLEVGRHLELVAVPEVRIEERLRDIQLVIGIIRVRHRPDVLVAAQDRARHRRHNPALGIERGCRDFLALRRYLRGTLQFPVAARQPDFAVRRSRLYSSLRNQATFTHHLDFAQDITAFLRRLFHQDTHVARQAFRHDFVGRVVAARQFRDVLPLFRIVGDLDFTLGCLVYPVEDDFIEAGAAAQIDVNPFLVARLAHPRAVEELRRLHLHQLVFFVEIHVHEGPVRSPRHLQRHAVVAILGRLGNLDRLVDDPRRKVALRALLVRVRVEHVGQRFARQPLAAVFAQVGPRLAVVRALADDFVALRRLVSVVSDSPAHIDAVGLLGVIVQGELEIGVRAHRDVARIRTLVDHPLALAPGLVAVGGREVDVLRLLLGDDAVGNQLRHQIVVVARRLVGAAQQGYVAIGRVVRQQFWREVFTRVSRILPDAACEVVRPLERFGRGPYARATPEHRCRSCRCATEGQYADFFLHFN